MLATGGGEEKFSRRTPYRNCTFLTKFFLKTWKFPNKKGTFDVNLVFTATLACTKSALFITKKGTFSPFKKFGGARAPVPPPPGSYAPDNDIKTYITCGHIHVALCTQCCL
jgi:hypothetical protein